MRANSDGKSSHAAVAAGDDDITRHAVAVEAAALRHKQLETVEAGDETVAVLWLVAREGGVHLVVTHEIFGGSGGH